MRRALTHLTVWMAITSLAGLALASPAPATPTVRLKALPVPIPGFPHTGDILGAGTAAQAEYTIEGNEYFGSPPPLIGVNFYLPSGAKVHPQGLLSSFYAPGGGMEFFTDGHSPVSLEILSSGHYVNLDGAGGSGPELIAQVPLVASVPGAPYASVRLINLKVGSAYRTHGHTIYYGRVPSKCPKGGLLMKTEVIFAEDGEPSRPETVDASYTAPCPKH